MILISGAVCAQTQLSKNYEVKKGQKVSFAFDYPALVKISTWDKNEIEIKGSVSINDGKNNDAFRLTSTVSGNSLFIDGKIGDIKAIPQRITIRENDEKLSFENREAYEKYCREQHRTFSNMSMEPSIDIELEIKVPGNTETKVDAVYGLVEIRNFTGPIAVNATYGGIDATIPEKTNVSAETSYGQIYSAADIKFSNTDVRDFHSAVTANAGKGPGSSFISRYGNIYLRK